MSNKKQDHFVDVNKMITAVEWLIEKWSIQGTLYSSDINQAKEMEKQQSSIWYKTNPEKDGDYICRMDNAYIKLCHYKDGLWFDMWKGDIDREVKEWMNIPYNK